VNIVLIGYRGTGKSTVANLLAQRLHRPVISTDAEIIAKAGLSIPDIVQQFGWEHFRELETTICRGVTDQKDLVIDTGGGVILKDENVAALKSHGLIFWLTAEISTIAARIGDDTQRPSLSGAKTFIEEIEEVLHDREPKYRDASDHVVPTDSLTPEQIVESILARIPTK